MGRIPLDEPRNAKKIVRDKRGSKRGIAKRPTIITSDERRHGSLRPRHWLDDCCCCLPWSFWEY
jgi:hypothetical protein